MNISNGQNISIILCNWSINDYEARKQTNIYSHEANKMEYAAHNLHQKCYHKHLQGKSLLVAPQATLVAPSSLSLWVSEALFTSTGGSDFVSELLANHMVFTNSLPVNVIVVFQLLTI